MRIAVVGAGFVGVAAALQFCQGANHVRLIDVDGARVRALHAGRLPFREPQMARVLRKALRARRLEPAKDPGPRAFDLYVICVGTPPRRDGSADLRSVQAAATTIGRHLRASNRAPVVAVKSTVPPGTLERRVVPALESASGRADGGGFFTASLPEFLSEGRAWQDTLRPSRVVVGTSHEAAFRLLRRLHAPLRAPILRVPPATAEMTKYASNAFLALKISFANELARWSTPLGVDSSQVVAAMGLDPRIAPGFLRAGPGFGGSCFPKDVRALRALVRSLPQPARLLDALLQVNDDQPAYILALARRALGTLRGRSVALLGLSFKAGTDDVRETRALPLYRGLRRAGARVTVWDPVSARAFERLVGGQVQVAPTLGAALSRQDAAIVQADWPQLRRAAPRLFIRRMRRPVLIDARRCVDPNAFEAAGGTYYGMGWIRRPPDAADRRRRGGGATSAPVARNPRRAGTRPG